MKASPEVRALPPTLLLLTATTGLVDAASFLGLGHVFTANMTGNIVFLGFAIAGASGLSVSASLVALASFLLGALAGGRLATVTAAASRRQWLVVATGGEALLLAAGDGVCDRGAPRRRHRAAMAGDRVDGSGDGTAQRHRPTARRCRPHDDGPHPDAHRSRRGLVARGRREPAARSAHRVGGRNVSRRTTRRLPRPPPRAGLAARDRVRGSILATAVYLLVPDASAADQP